MELKNKVTTFLVAVFMFSNLAPLSAYAVQEGKLTRAEKKQMQVQAQRKESALEIVNFAWWEDFEDEYLNSYILRAIEHNQDLKIATLRVEEARQAMKMQFAAELPSFSVGASPAVLKLPGATNSVGSFAVPIVASYELDLFLKNRDKTKSAKKLWEASKFQEKSAYISIVSAVGTCYYNIVKLDKLIALQEEIIKDRKTIYELMSLRNKHGITSTADVVRAEKAYVFATSDMYELKKAREIALNALAVLVGDSPNNIAEYKRIAYDNIKSEKAIPETISSEVITSRPDYLVAEKMVDKSRLDVRVAKKEFLPTIDILGMLSFASTSISNMGSMNWTNAVAGAGGMVNLPLFTGGRKITNLKLASNKYQQVLENYHKTNLTAIQEVNDALATLKIDNEKYLKNDLAYKMEEKDYKYTTLRYENGTISKLDLLQRKEALLSIEKMVVSSRVNNQINQIGLYKSTAAAL